MSSQIIDTILNDPCGNCHKGSDFVDGIAVDKIVIRNGNITVFLRCNHCGSMWNRNYVFKAKAKTL